MPEEPFYKEHWINIEVERLERYQSMFSWNPASKPLYDSAGIQEGQIIADFGCGPGHTAVELARWVGSKGHVHAMDINEGFIDQSRQNARDAGFSDRITPYLSDGSSLPFPDSTIDLITTRNTLIYVDDPETVLAAFHRAIRGGGKVHAIEGDWPMMVAEPIPAKTWTALVEAAAYACRTPDIGRKLAGILSKTGFTNVELEVVTRPDLEGRLLPMIRNIANYARESGQMDAVEIDEAIRILEQSLVDKEYLVLAPQFVVAAAK